VGPSRGPPESTAQRRRDDCDEKHGEQKKISGSDMPSSPFSAHHVGLFGFKELGGSEEVGSVFSHFRCSSKHRKRKIEKILFFISFLFYTTISSLPECYS